MQDIIIQESQGKIILYRDKGDRDVMVHNKSHCLCEWIKIKETMQSQC